MKWLIISLLVCMITEAVQAASFNESDLFPFFYELWDDSAFGRDPNRTERAAWIIDDTSRLQLIRWPTSFQRSKEIWKGLLPVHLFAQIHTHPVIDDPRPSRSDIELAQQIRISIYTVSGKGIWKATPQGAVFQIDNENWFDKPVQHTSEHRH